jgi:cation transport protein ChaC
MMLTPELVTRAARSVEDAGPSPGAVYLGAADYDRIVGEILSDCGGDLWLFAYGSLLWNRPSTSSKADRPRCAAGIGRSASGSRGSAARAIGPA